MARDVGAIDLEQSDSDSSECVAERSDEDDTADDDPLVDVEVDEEERERHEQRQTPLRDANRPGDLREEGEEEVRKRGNIARNSVVDPSNGDVVEESGSDHSPTGSEGSEALRGGDPGSRTRVRLVRLHRDEGVAIALLARPLSRFHSVLPAFQTAQSSPQAAAKDVVGRSDADGVATESRGCGGRRG